MRILTALLILHVAVQAQTLTQRIEAITRSTPAARQAFWGIRIVDLATGNVMYEKNANSFFVPASNTKLFTTATALMQLGPTYQFHTRVTAPAPDSNGRVPGDLNLVGGGDPDLSARILPYKKDEYGPNPLQAIDALADSVVQRGIRRIDGDIVGDDTAYVWDAYPDGWAIDDAVWEYGAPVSALTLNDNAFTVRVHPGAAEGELAVLSISPHVEHFVIENRVRTVAAGERKLHFARMPGSHELKIWGTIPLADAGTKELLAVDDPALFAAHALKDALEDRGVMVSGQATVRHRGENDPVVTVQQDTLADLPSQPLIEVLRVLAKESQNLHTELVLREVARASSGSGSVRDGLAQVKRFLTEIGVDDGQYHFDDASGLSRKTLVTPLTISKLLTYMYASRFREEWVGVLPIGGMDGSLTKRFKSEHGHEVHAKTGTISHVCALSGYVLPAASRGYSFSILVNNFNADANGIRPLVDKIVMTLLP